ncbi:short-chain fatty acyl-CoA regulator family protein [Sulfitobacter sp. D35]|uniref:short-chain fatty acyl-CoA regulator family protein n=1 Tax=Sulfitobacter sp. D35 TaxID=3083252 RepID=UPI00296F90AF|nr:short-chain fatty acyl-CoA regulator family protein [Sulfitobacter sp. D35]MDW4497504.1 short-chain fatty acyl-CoA regulator family protein [Sulfitobacter sp. D35]
MAGEGLTGSRIRERRSVAGLRQAELARMLGISASYLNLIEHNRRRIGGKLLLDIARALGVEPSTLTIGAEAAQIATLREAAMRANLAAEEVQRADELAGRFPAWAEVLAAGHRRISTLERTVETLTDRLAHDPQLAASVHELLSTAASIRSTASILADEPDLDAEWRERFHGNLNEDSRRLAESSRALVGYLDAGQGNEEGASSPQEEVEAFLAENDYLFPALEAGEDGIDAILGSADSLRSKGARSIAQGMLGQIAQDAARVPLSRLRDTLGDSPPDPVALARTLEAPVVMILRRLASLPELNAGLVVCDRAGSLLFRKATRGFVIPRYGSACPLWPLFSVLSDPGRVDFTPLVQLGRGRAGFACYATAETVGAPAYNAPPLVQATMLLLPRPEFEEETTDGTCVEVGSNCRVCPRKACPGRREPSILSEGL